MVLRASDAGILLHYRFHDGTEMLFRISELFPTNRELLEAMVRHHGAAEILNPEALMPEKPEAA